MADKAAIERAAVTALREELREIDRNAVGSLYWTEAKLLHAYKTMSQQSRALQRQARRVKRLRARIATLEQEKERWKRRAQYIGEHSGNSDAVYFGMCSADVEFDARSTDKPSESQPGAKP